jgi:hypothetical protein
MIGLDHFILFIFFSQVPSLQGAGNHSMLGAPALPLPTPPFAVISMETTSNAAVEEDEYVFVVSITLH